MGTQPQKPRFGLLIPVPTSSGHIRCLFRGIWTLIAKVSSVTIPLAKKPSVVTWADAAAATAALAARTREVRLAAAPMETRKPGILTEGARAPSQGHAIL